MMEVHVNAPSLGFSTSAQLQHSLTPIRAWQHLPRRCRLCRNPCLQLRLHPRTARLPLRPRRRYCFRRRRSRLPTSTGHSREQTGTDASASTLPPQPQPEAPAAASSSSQSTPSKGTRVVPRAAPPPNEPTRAASRASGLLSRHIVVVACRAAYHDSLDAEAQCHRCQGSLSTFPMLK